MSKNGGFNRAVNVVLKQAHANATRCFLVWTALALREEGYESEDLKRVLDNILKYSKTTLGKNDIDTQLKHIENVTGLRIVWTREDEITLEEIEEIEQLEVD